MDCATLCLLSIAVGMRPVSDTKNCTYCVEARSSYADCFVNALDCAYRDPKSMIFCLTVYEERHSGMITKTIRCMSYADFMVSDKEIIDVSSHGVCSVDTMQYCECSTCLPPTTTSTTTTESPRRRTTTVTDGRRMSARYKGRPVDEWLYRNASHGSPSYRSISPANQRHLGRPDAACPHIPSPLLAIISALIVCLRVCLF